MGRRPVKVKVKRMRSRLIDLFGARARVDVVAQQVLDHEAGIFSYVKSNDIPATLEEIAKNPQCLCLRDSVGAAPIHVAFLYGHFELGKQMVLQNKQYATLVYTALLPDGSMSPYEGENILHIAIVHRQRTIVQWLVHQVPELIQAETIGSFFRPAKVCYFGGTPLLFALSSNQIDMALDILDAADRLRAKKARNGPAPGSGSESGADHVRKSSTTSVPEMETSIFMCDRFGNNVLHMAVLHDLPNIYNFALLYAMHVLSPIAKPCSRVTPIQEDQDQGQTHLTTVPDTMSDHEKEERRRQERLATFTPRESTDGATKVETLVEFLKRVDDVAYAQMLRFLLQRNSDELTPLSLAAAVGNKRMFEHVLKHATFVSWTYGPITALAIPLRDLEQPISRTSRYSASSQLPTQTNPTASHTHISLAADHLKETLERPTKWAKDASGNYMTAIQCLCSLERLSNTVPKNSTDLQHIITKRLEILCMFEVKQLLRKKWKYVGKKRFMTRFAIYIVYMVLLNAMTLFKQSYLVTSASNWHHVVLGLLETLVVIICVVRFVNESRQLLFNFKTYITEAGAGRLDNICTVVVCLSVFSSVVMRLAQQPEAEDALSAIALVFSWFYCFFFLLGFRYTGPFVIMILRMISNDIARFIYVYVAVMAGFSQALYLVIDGRAGVSQFIYRARQLIIAGFTGEVNYDDRYLETRMNPLTQLLMFGYVVLVMILLVNLLIAMMGNTYNEILAESEQRWFAERANIMATIENQASREHNDAARRKYAIPLETRPNTEQGLYLQLEINDLENWKKQISAEQS